MYNKEEIIYHVFLKCCNLCKNNFWVNIFTDLSKGITPYGTYISKGYFCCSYKNKEFNYKIDNNKNPSLVYQEVKELLCNKLKLTSLSEKIEQIKILKHKTNKDDVNYSIWGNIRKKSTRKLLIDKFVIEKGKEYDLTLKQQKKLLNLINYFLLIKNIQQKDIVLSNNKINNINGITFSSNNIHIDDKLKQITVYESSNKNMIQSMKSHWDKYLKDIYKLSQSLE